MLKNLLKGSLKTNGCQRLVCQCLFEMYPHLNKKFWYIQDLSWPFLALVVKTWTADRRLQLFLQLLVINFILVLIRVFCYNICNLYLSFVFFFVINNGLTKMQICYKKKEKKSYVYKGKKTQQMYLQYTTDTKICSWKMLLWGAFKASLVRVSKSNPLLAKILIYFVI